ncbi:hypothetical protein Pth03_81130 [Planotetraspora thailandica]|uniref:AB hydrolase-1 domain-containing protein n=2 Tax=Planotetraspora thailandica TaxID=487172 RepID=A0A8J3Y2R8_9ACTN|nr:hypothetical protein Pth03_81130 [Planotetraspora thailandica]
MIPVRHLTGDVNGLTVFHREAAPKDVPTIVLLRGFPSSSHMFRNRIPALADRCHVVDADHIGFGCSSAPPVEGAPVAWVATTVDHGADHGLPRARWRGPESDCDRSGIAGCRMRRESRP